MPPKAKPAKASDAISIPKKSFQLTVKASYAGKEDLSLRGEYSLRISCEWFDCCLSTEVIGSVGFPYKEDSVNDEKYALYYYDFDLSMALNSTKFHSFNEIPGIFVFLIKKTDSIEPNEVPVAPVSFAYVDCSMFACKSGQTMSRSESVDDLQIDVSIVCTKPLLSSDDILKLDPLSIEVQGISRYPILKGQTTDAAMNTLYLHHKFELGGGMNRLIFGKPQLSSSVSTTMARDNDSSDSDNEDVSGIKESASLLLDLHVCLFPGLTDVSAFKEALTSTTFTIELYSQSIKTVIFTPSVREEFCNQFKGNYLTSKPGDKSSASGDKGKDKDGSKKKESVKQNEKPLPKGVVGPLASLDSFLIKCVVDSLNVHRDLHEHGSVRYRLDQLLSDSAEIQRQFTSMKNTSPSNLLENPIGVDDNHILIADDITMDIRYENPSKPQPWKMPTDTSLKTALNNHKNNPSKKSKTTKLSIFEQCLEYDTQLYATVTYMKNITKPPPLEIVSENNVATIVSPKAKVSITSPKSGSTITSPKNTLIQSKIPEKKSSVDHRDAIVLKDNLIIKAENILTTILASSKLDDKSKRELSLKLAVTPYGRMVIVMDYDDDEFLIQINDILNEVNSKALPNIQGTIKSYTLSSAEIDDVKNGKLDLISGFMLIDEGARIIVLEGLAFPGYSMEFVYNKISHDTIIKGPDNKNTKILYHPGILFPNRLYPTYAPDIKRIHLRYKLKKLITKSELYSREQIDIECYDGIDRITSLLCAEDLYTCKKFDLFPYPGSLNKLELLYGEAISREDILGTTVVRNQTSSKSKADKNVSKDISEHDMSFDDTLHQSKKILQSRLPPTNTWNQNYTEFLRNKSQQQSRNYLQEQLELKKIAYEELLLKKQYKQQNRVEYLASLGIDSNTANPKVYVYSTQSMNYKRKAFQTLRERLFHNNGIDVTPGVYTYSKDYVSQTFSYQDNDEIQAKLFAYTNNHNTSRQTNDHKLWITSKGFRYPVPETYQENHIHPHKPSNIRIEELKEPWPNDMKPPPGSFGTNLPSSLSQEETIKMINKEKNFHAFNKTSEVFGMLEKPVFEHPYEQSYVGNRDGSLPRGNIVNSSKKDQDFFKSIHVGGDEKQRILEEAMKKEKEEWKAKVVVDHEDFKVGGFLVKDRVTSHIDRYTDILHDEPQRLTLKSIRNKKSTLKGYNWSYGTTPTTIINKNEPYIDGLAKMGLRVVEKDKFITARDMNGDINKNPKDFTRYLSSRDNQPRVVSMLATRSIKPLDRSLEPLTGPKWDPL